MEKRDHLKKRILRIIVTINSHHTGAYAAQAAYFFVLSLIPIFLLLLTMVQFTPVTMNDVLQAVLQVFPSTVTPLIRSIVIQVYTQSGAEGVPVYGDLPFGDHALACTVGFWEQYQCNAV